MNEEITDLIERASEHIRSNYQQYRHHVAAALKCNDKVYLSLHLDTKGFDVCAEPIALSNALANGETDFKYIVAVIMNKDGSTEIVSPCGNCRQMLLQYCPDVEVILNGDDGITTVTADKLLPWPYN